MQTGGIAELEIAAVRSSAVVDSLMGGEAYLSFCTICEVFELQPDQDGAGNDGGGQRRYQNAAAQGTRYRSVNYLLLKTQWLSTTPSESSN